MIANHIKLLKDIFFHHFLGVEVHEPKTFEDRDLPQPLPMRRRFLLNFESALCCEDLGVSDRLLVAFDVVLGGVLPSPEDLFKLSSNSSCRNFDLASLNSW